MTQEEKELLLKDLCARLPYETICEYGSKVDEKDIGKCRGNLTGRLIDSYFKGVEIHHTKVYSLIHYLRPISSMTKEEECELRSICIFGNLSDDYDEYDRCGIEIMREINNTKGNHQKKAFDFVDFEELMDWLNSHHFDYRGLIPMGLALEATEDMYNI